MKKGIVRLLLILSVAFFSVSSYAASRQWTVMVYIAADNDLEKWGIDDFEEMAEVGSCDNVNIVVQFDRNPHYDSRYGNWTICHRFYITQGMEPTEANAIADWGDGQGGRELNTGHPDTLRDFVTWGVSNYPAERYALILWNHGDGWKTLLEEKVRLPFRAICWDDTDNDALTMKQVRQALENAGHYMDIIGFDACLMSMLEVATEIKDLGSVMVASEDLEPATGWNYTGFLTDLGNMPGMTAAQLSASIVNSYVGYGGSGPTLSAIDLLKIPDFNESLDELLSEIIALGNEWMNVHLARSMAQYFSHADSVDIYGFLADLSARTGNPHITALAEAAMDVFKSLVIANHSAGSMEAHGLAVYFPDNGRSIDGKYTDSTILFPGETLWRDFLIAYTTASVSAGRTIFHEDFSGCMPGELPPGWTVIDGGSDGHTWHVTHNSVLPPGFSSPFITPPYMLVDSDAAGHVPMDEQLITPPIDLTGYESVFLGFNHFFYYNSVWEKADVDIQVAGGTWHNLRRYQAADAEGTVIVDISGIAAGQDDVRIRWRYHDALWDWFWAVGEVSIFTFDMAGDINGDGLVNISDVILCLRMSVKLPVTIGGQEEHQHPYPEWLVARADINEDDIVNISDVILIMRRAIGLD